MKYKLFLSVFIGILLLSSCQSEILDDGIVSPENQNKINNNSQILSKAQNELQKELAMARKGTAKYHNIDKALEDGYVDIGLFIPGMGWHFLNGALIDDVFDPSMPEVLVYDLKPNGEYRLVAVEYLSPGNLPVLDGFSGEDDVWVQVDNGTFWAVHAWIWYNNPDGIFAPTNSRL